MLLRRRRAVSLQELTTLQLLILELKGALVTDEGGFCRLKDHLLPVICSLKTMLEAVFELNNQLFPDIFLLFVISKELLFQFNVEIVLFQCIHYLYALLLQFFLLEHELLDLLKFVLPFICKLRIKSSGLLHLLQHCEGESTRNLRADAQRVYVSDSSTNSHLFLRLRHDDVIGIYFWPHSRRTPERIQPRLYLNQLTVVAVRLTL